MKTPCFRLRLCRTDTLNSVLQCASVRQATTATTLGTLSGADFIHCPSEGQGNTCCKSGERITKRVFSLFGSFVRQCTGKVEEVA